MSAADLAKLLAKKVDILDTAEDRLTLTVNSATVLAKSGLALASRDTVTVVDTGAKDGQPHSLGYSRTPFQGRRCD